MTYNYNYMYIYLSVLIKQTFNSTHFVQVNRDFILKGFRVVPQTIRGSVVQKRLKTTALRKVLPATFQFCCVKSDSRL